MEVAKISASVPLSYKEFAGTSLAHGHFEGGNHAKGIVVIERPDARLDVTVDVGSDVWRLIV